MDNPQNAEDKRNILLLTLYRLATRGTKSHIDVYDLERESNIGDEFKPALDFLRQKQFLVKRNLIVQITVSGTEEAERIMAETYAEKEARVLRKIYDLGGPSHTEWVLVTDLLRELEMKPRELYSILTELEKRKDLIEGVDQAVWMAPAGLELIESGGQRAGSAAPNVSYTTNIHGPNYGGIQQGTHESTQNITLTNTNNPDFDRALASLVELIRSSQIPEDDKQEIEEEVGKVNKLALREPAPGMLERAKTRLDMIKLAITGTDIAMKAAPHINTLWELLQQRFGGN